MQPLEPTRLSYSSSSPFPIDTYEIAMMKTRHKFMPSHFPST